MSGDARQEDRSRWITETEWTEYIQEDPDCPHLRNRGPSDVSIFRVPKLLKDTQREAYVPLRVSLGPYHHGSAELPPMGHHKGRALRRMMKSFNANRNLPVVPNNMDFAVRAMAEILKMEKEIRDSYEENIDCDGETLARMLCLDGCFLIEVLRTAGDDQADECYECYDPIFGAKKLSYAARDVLNDLLILENQIPFIVLLKLLQLELNSGVDNVGELELNSGIEEKHLDALAKKIAYFFFPFDNTNLDREQPSHHRHLLDFLHAAIARPTWNEDSRVDEGERSMCFGCCSRQYPIKSKERKHTERIPQRIPHAVELRNAGIKFSALQEGCIKRIKFDENKATIFLPPIPIMDGTERLFRNLIAYEMCKPSEESYVSSYVALMKDLIDTEQDVALMRRMGVLKNWLGSDKEVADLFNGLGKQVTVSPKAVFEDLAKKVNAHYNNEIKVQIGKLVQDHFSSPWTALALTAAGVMLVLTVLQTIFTIISTYKK